MTRQRISSVGAIVVSALGLAACGGSAGSSEVVARVDGVGAITKAMLDHWIPIEGTLSYKVRPLTPAPKGLIPDPPSYTACMAYLKATPQKLVQAGPKPSPLELKRKCAQRNKELQEITLNTLIGYEWTIGAGLQSGVKPTDAEIKKWFDRVTRTENPNKGEFAKYLRYSGQSVADMIYRSKIQLVEVKLTALRTELEKKVRKGLTPKLQLQVSRFMQVLPPNSNWIAKTTCRTGYSTSDCGRTQPAGSAGF